MLSRRPFLHKPGVVKATTLDAEKFLEAVALGVSEPLTSKALRYAVELQWRLNGDDRPENLLQFVNFGIVARWFQVYKENPQGFF